MKKLTLAVIDTETEKVESYYPLSAIPNTEQINQDKIDIEKLIMSQRDVLETIVNSDDLFSILTGLTCTDNGADITDEVNILIQKAKKAVQGIKQLEEQWANMYTPEESPFAAVEKNNTVSRSEWLATMGSKNKHFEDMISGGYKVSIDFEVEEMFKDVIIGYIEGPVGYYKDTLIEIDSRGFCDLKFIEEFRSELLKRGQKIIFYMAIRYDVMEEFRDTEGYENLPQHWAVRFKIV